MLKAKLNKIGNLIDKIKSELVISDISSFLEWFYEKLDLHFNKKADKIIPSKGEIYFVNLGKNIGTELNKNRPCIVYSDYFKNFGKDVIIIPLKSFKGKINNDFNFFINKKHVDGISKDSIVDLMSVRNISKKRLGKVIGKLDKNYLEKIDKKLLKILNIKK